MGLKFERALLPGAAVAFSAILWGLWWIPLRWLDEQGLRGDWASFAIFAMASLAILPFVLRRRRKPSFQLKPLLIIGVSLGLAFVMWNHAVIHGNVIRVVLLFYLAPVWATIMARFMLAVPIPPIRWAAILLGLGGAAVILEVDLMTTDSAVSGFALPDVMGLLAGISFAFSATATRTHNRVAELDKTFVSVLAATAIALLFVLLLKTPPPGAALAPLLGGALAVALLFLLPSTALLLWGAGRLDPGRVALLLLLEVVTAAVSSAWLAAEPFGGRQLLGCALILVAGLLETLPGLKRKRS